MSDDETKPTAEPTVLATVCCTAHCYHDTGLVLLSYPPQYPTRCCQCGCAGPTRRDEPPKVPEGHGRFHPNAGGGW